MTKAAYIGVNGKARKIKQAYIGIGANASIALPSGYTQVEYIKSTGTQAINTGVVPDINTRVTMDFELTEQPAANEAMFGAEGNFAVRYLGANSPPVFRHNTGTAVKNFSQNIAAVGRHQVDKNGKTCTLDDKTTTTNDSSITNASQLAFCAYNNNGTLSNYSKIIIREAKIYQQGELVRDFVPCTDSGGNAGLFDLVNNTFYASITDTAFVAGGMHKITKAYIGVNGVARAFWGRGELVKYGSSKDGVINQLGYGRYDSAATTVGNYALFGCGESDAEVDAYNISLIHSTPPSMSSARDNFAATTVGNYALFGGGTRSLFGAQSEVDAYDMNLTRTSPTGLSSVSESLAATSVGEYALFGGGHGRNNYTNVVTVYDVNLTRGALTSINSSGRFLAATTVGEYALFGGGFNGQYVATVTAFDSDLTKINATSLSVARSNLAATTVGKYALFGGGQGSSNANTAVVDAYDESLTRTTPAKLKSAARELGATTVGDYALFGGGVSTIAVVNAYDIDLVKSTPEQLAVGRYSLSATTVGGYALFGGGRANTTSSAVVDVYTVI